MVTRAQRQRGLPGLTSMPPQVLHAIIAASGDEQQLSAALASTCRALKTTVAEMCTTLHLRQFGSGRQVAGLLQRCTGNIDIAEERLRAPKPQLPRTTLLLQGPGKRQSHVLLQMA